MACRVGGVVEIVLCLDAQEFINGRDRSFHPRRRNRFLATQRCEKDFAVMQRLQHLVVAPQRSPGFANGLKQYFVVQIVGWKPTCVVVDGIAKVGILEVGIAEVGTLEVGTAQVDTV